MHARVSFYEGQPADIDAAVEAFRSATDALQQVEGHKGATLLIDRINGKSITVTYWDTEEHLQASVEAANRLRQQAADTSGLSIKSVDNYEVAIDTGH